MSIDKEWWFRIGVLCRLVEESPGLGRTALMKLAFLLQTIKDVPLGYYFRLYSYGPFDSDVLGDLAKAESLGALKADLVHFDNGPGYGYEFSVGPNPGFVKKRSEDVEAFNNEIRWVLTEFGHYCAADLELISTIIYADREAARGKKSLSFDKLRSDVKAIKPKFSDGYIASKVNEVIDKGLLVATAVNK